MLSDGKHACVFGCSHEQCPPGKTWWRWEAPQRWKLVPVQRKCWKNENKQTNPCITIILIYTLSHSHLLFRGSCHIVWMWWKVIWWKGEVSHQTLTELPSLRSLMRKRAWPLSTAHTCFQDLSLHFCTSKTGREQGEFVTMPHSVVASRTLLKHTKKTARRANAKTIHIHRTYRTSSQSSLPYRISHHQHLSFFMQLYNRMTANVLAFP